MKAIRSTFEYNIHHILRLEFHLHNSSRFIIISMSVFDSMIARYLQHVDVHSMILSRSYSRNIKEKGNSPTSPCFKNTISLFTRFQLIIEPKLFSLVVEDVKATSIPTWPDACLFGAQVEGANGVPSPSDANHINKQNRDRKQLYPWEYAVLWMSRSGGTRML